MRFLVLGPLEVVDERGHAVPIAGSKERTILAQLIARWGRVVPSDELIEELWGDAPPRTAERTLVSYVSRLLEGKTGGGYLQRTAIVLPSVGVAALALRVRALAQSAGDPTGGSMIGHRSALATA